MIFALIPAGGRSERMGRPKLALPLGDRTVLEHVVAALRNAAVENVLVVVGPHVPELASLAAKSGADALLLTEATADMRATVEHGLRWLEEHRHRRDDDALLLVPADHPTLSPNVVRQLVQEREANPAATIVIPTFGGRRGHPVLFAWSHVAAIRAFPQGQGINAYVRQQPAAILEVAVASTDILDDLDTPEDYERLRLSWQGDWQDRASP
jgi:CTP:molybdopterin cytidylyltransferase MocA